MSREQRLLYLNPRDLRPSTRNVRSDPGDLAGLAETIREHGLLQPLGVERDGDGYRIVFGNRRRDAAIVVGLDRVPCLELEPLDDNEVLVRQLLENVQRLELNDLDKAQAFEALLGMLNAQGASQAEALDYLARLLGLSTRQIQRYVRLNSLEPEVQRLIAQGEFGVTHAQHLGSLSGQRQIAAARIAVEEDLSAGELARLCAALNHNPNIEPRLALGLIRQGEAVPVVEQAQRDAVGRFHPLEEEDSQGEDTIEDNERLQPEAAGEECTLYPQLEPSTRDGNRVRRIHSLDSFMDELQRLTVCVQDGDLQRFMDEDEAAAVKLRLAARQLRFLGEAVTALAASLQDY